MQELIEITEADVDTEKHSSSRVRSARNADAGRAFAVGADVF